VKCAFLFLNFNESDISDKPAPERGNPKLTAAEVERAKTRLRCAPGRPRLGAGHPTIRKTAKEGAF